ncbi:DUF4327 family protein [Roseofilum capinflatum]|uniref:DUF4327 family protein n=1 Tax=Roseofilum capinflatum BLCC-M114 TaxID=3022440 RepID=A0ABT7B7Z5_9CYAN|nr:DUF4327 family protein [Roseofilum capinflatum BLCC-M114]
MNQQVVHPMFKLQSKVKSLVDSNILKPTDGIWKMAFLYGDQWKYWKKELQAYEFSMHDPVSELLAVEEWED